MTNCHNTNITNITNNIQLNIDLATLRAFGEESMSHITLESLSKAVQEKHPLAALSKLIRSVPENQNIYHSNKQAKTLKVFDGEKFQEHEAKQAYLHELLRMVNSAQRLIEDDFSLPRTIRFSESMLLNLVYDLRDLIISDDLDNDRLMLKPLSEIHRDDEDLRRSLNHAKVTLEALREHIHSLRKSVKPMVVSGDKNKAIVIAME